MNPIRIYIDREKIRKQRVYDVYLENLNDINSNNVYGYSGEQRECHMTYYHPTSFPDKTYCIYSDSPYSSVLYQVDTNGASKL